MGEREGWSWTDSSFSIRSAKAFRVTSKGSKPKSSSGCLEEPKPNAACQSVDDDTGIVSVGKKNSDKYKINSLFSKYMLKMIHYNRKTSKQKIMQDH